MKFFERLRVERRKVRWSSFSKTTKVFFITLIMIVLLTLIIVLFSFAAESILNLF